MLHNFSVQMYWGNKTIPQKVDISLSKVVIRVRSGQYTVHTMPKVDTKGCAIFFRQVISHKILLSILLIYSHIMYVILHASIF